MATGGNPESAGSLVWCKGIKDLHGERQWRGVHRLTARLGETYVALELVQVEDPEYRGEEITIRADRIHTDIWPENRALIKDYL